MYFTFLFLIGVCIGGKTFIGLQNYINLLIRPPNSTDFWRAALLTVEYVALSVPIGIGLSAAPRKPPYETN